MTITQATRSQASPASSTNEGSLSVAARIRKPSAKLVHLAATIYGRGGVGKTTLLGTMPGKGLVLDIPQIEGGTMVLSDKADRVNVFEVRKWGDFDDALRYLAFDKHDYKWVAIDTISAAQVLAQKKTFKDRDAISMADPHQVSQQDWGKIGQLNSELYYRYRQLPMHVLFLAQEQRREGVEEGTLEFQPAVSPASLQHLHPSMFLMGRLYTREAQDPETHELTVERRLRVGPHPMYMTKVRALPGRKVPAIIREPHLGKIFSYLLGVSDEVPQAASEYGLELAPLS